MGGRKGGSKFLRAKRARKGHAKRRAQLGTSTHYKGSANRRTKPTWW